MTSNYIMIGTVTRKIGDYNVKNAQCEHCKEQNTLVATVYSKLFLLSIFPFVYGKSLSLSCSNCKKTYGDNDLVAKNINLKISVLRENAEHDWVGYIGYALLLVGAIFGMFQEMS